MTRMVIGFTADALILDTAQNWLWPWGRGDALPSVAPGGEDSGAFVLFPIAGTLRNMFVRARTAPTGAGDILYSARKNGVNQPLSVLIAQSAAPHAGSDLVNTVSMAPGDRLGCPTQSQGSAPLTTGADYAANLEFLTDDPKASFLHWGFGNNVPVGTHQGFPGYGSVSTTVRPHIVPRDGVLRDFYVRNGTNFGATSTYVYTILVNGVPSAVVISVPLASGVPNASNVADSVAVVAGDRVTCELTVGAASSGTDRMSAAVGYYQD